jgi:septum formation protein
VSETRRLILASSSPRRRNLLEEAGFRFDVEAPDVAEAPLPDEDPDACARRLALEKLEAVAPRAPADCCLLAADTVVALDGDSIGKPRDTEEAVEMLLRLSGRTHRVFTGFAVGARGQRVHLGLEESRVRMRRFDREEARVYAETGEPLDKAGGYALQGVGGGLVEEIEGSRSNVIGLPLEAVVPVLDAFGVARCRS